MLPRLAANADADWPELTSHWRDGRIKLALTHRLLSLRNEMPALFRDGAYEPAEVAGPDRDHILAFRRFAGRDHVVVAVARHMGRMTHGGHRWPGGNWQAELKLDHKIGTGLRDALSRNGALCQSLEISRLFAALPVAVLRSR